MIFFCNRTAANPGIELPPIPGFGIGKKGRDPGILDPTDCTALRSPYVVVGRMFPNFGPIFRR